MQNRQNNKTWCCLLYTSIKDSFQKFPNRFLVYDDKRWGCKLFLNYKDNSNNEDFIKKHLSGDLKIELEDIKLSYCLLYTSV